MGEWGRWRRGPIRRGTRTWNTAPARPDTASGQGTANDGGPSAKPSPRHPQARRNHLHDRAPRRLPALEPVALQFGEHGGDARGIQAERADT
jgi:hypothetical protein